MEFTFRTLVLGIVVLGLASGSLAAEDKQRLPQLKNADRNSDGKVSFEEFAEAFPQFDRSAFDLYDKNEDGFLSREDIKGRGGAEPGGSRPGILALLQKADKDGNGEVTFEEIAAVAPNITRDRFERLDRNGDGAISEADRNAARKPSAGPGLKLRELAQKADTDADGKVTFEELQAEIPGLTSERFSRFDKNGDGVLSREDVGHVRQGGSSKASESRSQLTRKALEADKDGDGKVTYEELTAAKPGFPQAAFKRFDVNGDGVLSQEDAKAGADK